MAVKEVDGVLSVVNDTGDTTLIYPATRLSNVEGAQEALKEKADQSHTHAASQVTGLAKVATSGQYSDLSGIPSASDMGAIGFVRMLTNADDLNKLTGAGIYYFLTGNVPANAPYTNSSFVEVFGTNTGSRCIQRLTRFGVAGSCAFRPLMGDNYAWGDWKEIAIADSVVNKSGDTMSGNFYVQKTAPRIGVTNTDTGNSMDLRITTAGDGGLYDVKGETWMLRKTAAGATRLVGSADTLTTARKISGVAFDGSKDIALTAANVGALGYVRKLTASDDFDKLVEHGVYYYATDGVPANAPYANAAIVEVFGSGSTTSQTIQRVTRYGAKGYTSFRGGGIGNWTDWAQVATSPIALEDLSNVHVVDSKPSSVTNGHWYLVKEG